MTLSSPASALSSLLDAQVPAVCATNPSANVVADQKVQVMIFELVMRGMQFEEIAKICGLSEVQVEKLASSKWFESEIERRAGQDELKEDSLRSLLRVVAFKGAVKLGTLVGSKVDSVALSAIKLSLEYSLAPMKLIDQKRGSGDVPNVEDSRREADKLRKELGVIQKRQVTI